MKRSIHVLKKPDEILAHILLMELFKKRHFNFVELKVGYFALSFVKSPAYLPGNYFLHL